MQLVSERLGPERTWAGAVAALVTALVVGVLAFPQQVYDRFVWQYFWGPVVADAHSAACATRADGTSRMVYDSTACATALEPVAYPGYTLISEAGYAATLLLALMGVIFLLRRLGVGERRSFFYALVPFTFFGGALRVVEDAMDAVPQGVEPAISFPWNTLIISPIIYFTVFAITLAALVAAVWYARSSGADSYEYPLAAVGTAILVVTLASLAYLSATTDYVSFFPQIMVLVLVCSTLLTGLVWAGVVRYAPELLSGTGRMGALIVWGHAVDGVANVIASDWAQALGLPSNYGSKHPIDRIIVGITEGIFPPSVIAVTGDSWGFLLVKIVAALAVVWVFDETVFEDSPRYAILLLVAILAVGLGPGTRDMLRATFGI